MVTVFFSYSHRDEELRDELETHLSMLKRDGSISSWHDRRISPGDDFARQIDENLESADVVLLLVSAYFLASNYCFEVEMQRALERHERGECRVIPVILRPCDWHSAPFGHLLALPKDGKPITHYPDLHQGFAEVVEAIRAIFGSAKIEPVEKEAMPVAEPVPAQHHTGPRSSNLRVRKEFTQRDSDRFLEEGFEFMARFFENSLEELCVRNPGLEHAFRRVDANNFTAVIYHDGKRRTECKISFGGHTHGSQEIYFSYDMAGNGYNESLSVEDDGHTLYLKAMMMHFGHPGNHDAQLTHQGAAEYFWDKLIEPLQR